MPPPLHRAAIWQAARGGLSGRPAGRHPAPEPLPAGGRRAALVERLRPQLEELGDWDEVRELAGTTLARGNSADRQRAAFAERGRLSDVVELVVAETHGRPPARAGGARPAPLPHPRRRRGGRAGPPAPAGLRRPGRLLPRAGRRLDRPARRAGSWIDDAGLTFGVEGEQRPFSVDLVPRIISPHEWATLESGLIQRARAIEVFLHDVYGEQRIIADGVLTRGAGRQLPGWRAEAARLPAGASAPR